MAMASEGAHNGEIPAESASSAASSQPRPEAGVGGTELSARVAARTASTMRSLRMSSVGLELAISVLLGLFGGRWLDGRLGTEPWLMLVGICVGFAAGMRAIVRAMDRASRETSERAP
jgi:F0F1-type ATP synthase assembly protein I